MIKARHHWFYEWFFDGFIWLRMRFLFREIRIIGKPDIKPVAVLLIGNHSSWWDGFLGRSLCKKVFGRRFHVMVLERELSKRKFLRRLGAFSIRKNSRSALLTLDYVRGLLQDPSNLVLIYPQGELQSFHQRPLSFQQGWYRLLQNGHASFQIIFLASLPDFGSKPRLVVNHYLENYLPQAGAGAPEAEEAYNLFLERCINQQSKHL